VVTRFSKTTLLSISVLALIIAAGIIYFLVIRQLEHPPQMSPTQLIVGQLNSGRPIFLSQEYLPFVPADLKNQVPTPVESLDAGQHSATFYRLNREKHYGAVLVGAEPAWKPLAASLLQSPLWVLADVSPWGYLFTPIGSKGWSMPDEKTLEKNWPSKAVRTWWLIGTSKSLILIGRTREAQLLLDEAESTHRMPSLLLATKASLEASRGRWEEAMALSKQSLARDPRNKTASLILARALIECGHREEAYTLASQLAAAPRDDTDNGESFFLLARAAHAVGADDVEIESLNRLVELERRNGQPTGSTLTYLGQAYAKRGNRGEALRSLEQAFAAPELSDEQRGMIREIMDHLAVDAPQSATPNHPGSSIHTPSSPVTP